MTNDKEALKPRRGTWTGVAALATAHLAAFSMLYLVLVQITNSFSDHYSEVGYALTDRFSFVLRISNYVAASTWLVLLIIAIDLYVIYRLARSGSRWTSAYSHSALLSIGCSAFLAVAWLIHPMVWSRPGTVIAPTAIANATDSDPGVVVAASLNRK